jgi:hypothetical protein
MAPSANRVTAREDSASATRTFIRWLATSLAAYLAAAVSTWSLNLASGCPRRTRSPSLTYISTNCSANGAPTVMRTLGSSAPLSGTPARSVARRATATSAALSVAASRVASAGASPAPSACFAPHPAAAVAATARARMVPNRYAVMTNRSFAFVSSLASGFHPHLGVWRPYQAPGAPAPARSSGTGCPTARSRAAIARR